MKTSDSVKEIMPAILSVTDKMQASKDGKNPHFRSDYMTLDGILNSVKPVLKDVGIVILQSVDNNMEVFSDKATSIIECHTKLLHESGEYLESKCIVHADKMTPQGYGSAITYVRRYGITTMLGIAEADDDGNAAEGAATAVKKPVTKPKAKAKPTTTVKQINKVEKSVDSDSVLSEDQVNSIIKAYDKMGIEIWDLEKLEGDHEAWKESTRVKLLASYNNIQSGTKTLEDFKAGK